MKEELEQAYAAIKRGEEEQARVLLARMLKDDPEYIPGWVLMSKLAPNRMQKAAFLDKILSLDPGHIYARQEMEALEASVASGVAQETAGDLSEEEVIEAAAVDAPIVAGEDTPAGTPVRGDEEALELLDEDVLPEPAAAEPYVAHEVEAAEAETTAWQEDREVAEPEAAPRISISADPYDYEAQAAGDTLPPWLAEDVDLFVEEFNRDAVGDAERMLPEPELPDWLTEEPAAGWHSEQPAGGPVRLKEGAVPGAVEPQGQPRGPVSATGTPSWMLLALSIALIVVFLLLIYFGIRLLT